VEDAVVGDISHRVGRCAGDRRHPRHHRQNVRNIAFYIERCPCVLLLSTVIYRVGQKTGLFLRSDNFAAASETFDVLHAFLSLVAGSD